MEKEVIVTARINFTWPQLTEIIGSNELYGYMEFPMEYAPFDHYDLENMARAAELHSISMIIKPDHRNRMYVTQKAVTSGFEGVLFTGHTTATEVRETIRQITPVIPGGGALSFIGRHWIRNTNPSGQMDYTRGVCDIAKGFTIEEVEAVYNLEEICRVEEVDFLQLGPADFSMSSGFSKGVHPDEIEKVERYAIETVLRYGKYIRVEIRSTADAAYYYELNIRDFALGADLRTLRNFYKNEGDQLKETTMG